MVRYGRGACVVAAVSLAAVSCASQPPSVQHAQARPAPLTPPASEPTPPQPLAATSLSFAELFAQGPQLVPSDQAQRLAGQRVRMVGFMAELEHGPAGAFYLAPRPVHCDEAGAGTGDLPIESVLVAAPFLQGARVPHVAGAVEVVGLFDVGNRVDAEGFASSFRIELASPPAGSTQTRASDVSAALSTLSASSHRSH